MEILLDGKAAGLAEARREFKLPRDTPSTDELGLDLMPASPGLVSLMKACFPHGRYFACSSCRLRQP